MSPQTPSPLSSIGEHLAAVASVVRVDAVDLELLRLLSQDGRVSQKRLAEAMKMSAPAIAERIARLTQKGVITGYSTLINWDALGYSTVVYASIVISAGVDRGAVMTDLAAARGVEEVTLTTGSMDLFVKLRVRDYHHLRELLTDEIWRIDGIQRTETYIGLGRVTGINPGERILAELLEHIEVDRGGTP